MHDNAAPPPAGQPPLRPMFSRRAWIAAAVAAVLAAGLCVLTVAYGGGPPPGPARSSTPATAPPTRAHQQLLATLNTHGRAVVAGDEPGWLAAVDPDAAATYDYFRRLYTTLRTLQVTSWIYQADAVPPVYARTAQGLSARLDLDVGYCLVTDPCPPYQPVQEIGPVAGPHPAHLRLPVTVQQREGRWLITEVRAQPAARSWAGSNVPWRNADLVFASSDRVTVGAPAAQAGRLPEVLAVAGQAAAATDRFHRYLPTPRQRYLVFLAGEPQWRSWYHVGYPGADGYTMRRGTVGVDVVLRMSQATDPSRTRTVLRHEFGHVLTLHGVALTDLPGADLYEEGIAEYIAHAPAPATTSPRMPAVRRWIAQGRLPATLANLPRLADSAPAADRVAFYGLGHLMIDCLVHEHGEAATFAYFDRHHRQHIGDDQASRATFGTPWPTVERTCLNRIRQSLRE